MSMQWWDTNTIAALYAAKAMRAAVDPSPITPPAPEPRGAPARCVQHLAWLDRRYDSVAGLRWSGVVGRRRTVRLRAYLLWCLLHRASTTRWGKTFPSTLLTAEWCSVEPVSDAGPTSNCAGLREKPRRRGLPSWDPRHHTHLPSSACLALRGPEVRSEPQ